MKKTKNNFNLKSFTKLSVEEFVKAFRKWILVLFFNRYVEFILFKDNWYFHSPMKSWLTKPIPILKQIAGLKSINSKKFNSLFKLNTKGNF